MIVVHLVRVTIRENGWVRCYWPKCKVSNVIKRRWTTNPAMVTCRKCRKLLKRKP